MLSLKNLKRSILTTSSSSSYSSSLSNLPKTRISRLSNGFTVASETHSDCKTATVGVWIDAGSRFETTKNNGTGKILFNKKLIFLNIWLLKEQKQELNLIWNFKLKTWVDI